MRAESFRNLRNSKSSWRWRSGGCSKIGRRKKRNYAPVSGPKAKPQVRSLLDAARPFELISKGRWERVGCRLQFGQICFYGCLSEATVKIRRLRFFCDRESGFFCQGGLIAPKVTALLACSLFNPS